MSSSASKEAESGPSPKGSFTVQAERLGCQILHGGFMVHVAKMEIRCGHEAKATSALDAANEAFVDNHLSSHIAPSLRLQHSTAAILFAAKFKSPQEAEALLETAADVCMVEGNLHGKPLIFSFSMPQFIFSTAHCDPWSTT